MGAQNFNFVFKFLQNKGFQPQILRFWTKIYRQKFFRQFSDSPKFSLSATTDVLSVARLTTSKCDEYW